MTDRHVRAQIDYLDGLPKVYSDDLEAAFAEARDRNLVEQANRFNPTRRTAASLRKLAPYVAIPIDAKWTDTVGREWGTRLHEIDVAKREEIDRLLELVEIRTDGEWTEASRFSGYQWSNQPAHGSYAKGRADLDSLTLEAHGIETRVESLPVNKRSENPDERRFWPEFVVHAKSDSISIRAALRRGIDDPLAYLWSRGLNPAAMFPGLPHETSRAAFERSRSL